MLWISLLPILISTIPNLKTNKVYVRNVRIVQQMAWHELLLEQQLYYHYENLLPKVRDDLNNFKDLDKIKCVGSEEGIWLDTNSSVVLDVQADTLDIRCPHNHIVTAIWDDKFGFPSVNKVKCTKIAYGRVHSVVSELVRTGSKSGGPYGERDTWNVECPEGWAIIGLNKDVHRTVSINCAPLQPQYGFL